MNEGLSVMFVSPDDLPNYRKIVKALNRGLSSTPTSSHTSSNNVEGMIRVLYTTFAFHGFSVAASAVWNSLPSGIHNSSSAHTFRRLLQTHCLQQAFVFSWRLTQVPQIRPLADIAHCKCSFTHLLTYYIFTWEPISDLWSITCHVT